MRSRFLCLAALALALGCGDHIKQPYAPPTADASGRGPGMGVSRKNAKHGRHSAARPRR